MIREFARILVAGGIAGFAEPGPRHAEAPRSQFESQTYGVVERDVDVHELWRTAQACGFAICGCACFTGRRIMSRCGSTRTCSRAARRRTSGSRPRASSCVTCAASSSSRRAAERADSRTPDGLACDIRATLASAAAVAGTAARRSTRSSRTPAPRRGCLGRAARRRRARDASLRRVRHARDVRLPLRAADRPAARDSAGRHRPRAASRCRRSPPALPPRARLRRRARHVVRAGRFAAGGAGARSRPAR